MVARTMTRAGNPLVAVVIGLTLAASCSVMNWDPAPGWPRLTVREHVVDTVTMTGRCWKYTPFGKWPLACAEVDLAAKTCDIWIAELYNSQDIREHERMHCEGYDHRGESTLADLLKGMK